ncbi:MAG: hypothetical protein Q7K44_01055 [Candidatus Liptonbacteria bacterium]|nr:hypothetical protein [Candidatus Liptonbacteria bacterium]
MKKTVNVKTKKSDKMTLDNLAQMSQREFLAVGERFNKVDQRFDKVDEDMKILRSETEAGFSSVNEGVKTIMEKLDDIQRDVIEIHDLRGRVERLEKKVGLSH